MITDPPFAVTDCKWDRPVDLNSFWSIVRRKLKPAGVCAIFACGKFVPLLINSNPRWYCYDLVWEKTRPVGFLSANKRPLRAHESILVFAPRLHSSVYNPQKSVATKRALKRLKVKKQNSNIYHGHQREHVVIDDGSRHPRSVLKFASATPGIHPTQKPLALMEWLVKTYSNPGDLVVDPFLGSGTTAEACAIHGRRFFGSESNRRFFNLALKRLKKSTTGNLRLGELNAGKRAA